MKIAISLSQESFLRLEKLKIKLKKSRSELIQEAIECWLAGRRQKTLIDRYENGYRRIPEKFSHIASLERAQLETLSQEDWS